jgi:hypothetical protein
LLASDVPTAIDLLANNQAALRQALAQDFEQLRQLN